MDIKMKKIIAITVSLILIITLTGCGRILELGEQLINDELDKLREPENPVNDDVVDIQSHFDEFEKFIINGFDELDIKIDAFFSSLEIIDTDEFERRLDRLVEDIERFFEEIEVKKETFTLSNDEADNINTLYIHRVEKIQNDLLNIIESYSDSFNNYGANFSLQRVGAEHYGFVDIPDTWVPWVEIGGDGSLVQYADPDSTDVQTVLTLNVGDNPDADLEMIATAIYDNIESGGADAGATWVEFAGFEAIEIYGIYPDGTVLVSWIFQNDDNLNYISIEADIIAIGYLIELIESTFNIYS